MGDRRQCIIALAGCLVVGLVLLLPLWPHVHTHILADDIFIAAGRSDAYVFLWGHWWVQKAATEGLDLFTCHWTFPPNGMNLFFHTMTVLPSLLTLPLTWLLGCVASYNVMVWLMLCLGAFAYFCFLRTTFAVSPVTAFAVGLLFGFSPYALYKAHGQINMIGSCFWVGALGTLVSAYVTNRFTMKRGLLFGVCVWATYWTSFVEFFMLGISCAFTVLVFELARRQWRRETLVRKATFIAPVLVGSLSLISWAWAPSMKAIEVTFADRLRPGKLLTPPQLGLLGSCFGARNPDFAGIYLPISVAILAFVGHVMSSGGVRSVSRVCCRWLGVILIVLGAECVYTAAAVLGLPEELGAETVRCVVRLVALTVALVVTAFAVGWLLPRLRIFTVQVPENTVGFSDTDVKCVWLLAVTGFVLTLDFLGLPSLLFSSIPLGRGFRFLCRFFPFALFFTLMIAAIGVESLWQQRRGKGTSALLPVLCALTLLEYAPCGMRPSLVPKFHVPLSAARRLDMSGLVWVSPPRTPARAYVHAYQVALDMPFAHIPDVARRPDAAIRSAMEQYPILYGGRPEFSSEEFVTEAERLGVRYVLLEDARQYAGFPCRTLVLATDGGRVLLELLDKHDRVAAP